MPVLGVREPRAHARIAAMDPSTAPELVYSDCMARMLTTTVRLDPEDVQALAKAREDGLSASDLIRKGLRVVASRYYIKRRPHSTGLFVSTDLKLGEESELFKHLKR